MAWDDDLDHEQKQAASHVGCHACLVAGPGTGKTLVIARRIVYLVDERGVDPASIVALTFTRAAAAELRRRVAEELGEERSPRIWTLHSFALRQLLRNSELAPDILKPIRIADDWEERHIILEDLANTLDIDVRKARQKLWSLSAAWESLRADAEGWPEPSPDPKFIGAWEEHRLVYAYALRAELVYRLKLAVEQYEDFDLEAASGHVLVDEYQDLNRCDLAVVRALVDRGAELFAAGDDDQSIYGFRRAYPQGIREFLQDYPGGVLLKLRVTKRCDPEILKLGQFVAELDPRRVGKELEPEDGRPPGEVQILRFRHQDEEAQGIAAICRYVIDQAGYAPEDILILVRSDRNRVFSSVLWGALQDARVPVSASTAETNPLDEKAGRQVLALLRLALNLRDHLAWRTLLRIRRNQIGERTILQIHELARKEGLGFAQALELIQAESTAIEGRGTIVAGEICALRRLVEPIRARLAQAVNRAESTDAADELVQVVKNVCGAVISDDEPQRAVIDHIVRIIETAGATMLEDLVRALEVSPEGVEQEIEEGKVNVLTMHKAKGLTAKAVFIVAAEDEQIPGRAQSDPELGDERRLFYVSLTRAMHRLFVTYCGVRTGSQTYSGRTAGRVRRSLTRFLRYAGIKPVSGSAYVERLANLD